MNMSGPILPEQRTPLSGPILPEQRTPPSAWQAAAWHATTILVADPVRATRISLAGGLVDLGVDWVLKAETVSEVDAIIAGGPVRELALVSMGFGTEAVRLVHDLKQAGWPGVIALTVSADPSTATAAVLAGATGVLRRPAIAQLPRDPRLDTPGLLTPREIEVLRLIADGHGNLDVGAELGLSLTAVKSCLARIARRLGTGNRAEMVAEALRAGVIK